MSAEQDAVLSHPVDQHGLILAGPGTGKSSTVIRLVGRLQREDPDVNVRVVSFTRAATADLVDKIKQDGVALREPSTLHAFALSVLMRNSGLSGLPEPLRIPDTFEFKELIRPDQARRLKVRFPGVSVRDVEKLERELGAGWESLHPGQVLLADVDPQLRNAYVAVWKTHRRVFGYSLFAEMTYKAREVLEDHPGLRLDGLKLLVVDEYQDLNKCDIGMIQAVAGHGVSILAVGDDDQSIYSFRMAAPHGIWEFPKHFPGAWRYPLSVSFRCGETMLAAARDLIESAPHRPARESLQPGPDNPPGTLAYLRFPKEAAEVDGVKELVRHLIDVEGIPPREIVILMRGDHNRQWSKPCREALGAVQIAVTDVEAALEPLARPAARRLLALARIADDVQDNLAWWTLCKLTNGISDAYVASVADEATHVDEPFASRSLRVQDVAPANVTRQSQGTAVELVQTTLQVVTDLQSLGGGVTSNDLGNDGWAGWFFAVAEQQGIELDEDLILLLRQASDVVAAENGIRHFINQLEPVARDVALLQPGVSIMSIMRSKGLTFTAALVVGVEDPVIPRAGADEEEERRLLYVAMTRARRFLYLTMAARRTGPTARAGGGNPVHSRSRCIFFSGTTMH